MGKKDNKSKNSKNMKIIHTRNLDSAQGEETNSSDNSVSEATDLSDNNETTVIGGNESVEQELEWFDKVSKKIKEY